MSQSVIGSLRVNLGLDSAQFARGARGVDAPLKRMRKQFVAIAGVATIMGAALSAAAIKGAKEIDEAAKSARRLDASIGGFRALELAASEAGVSLSGLTNDIQTMNRELSTIGTSGNGKRALDALGLSIDDLAGKDADEKLAVIADQVQALGLDAGQTTAILRDLGVRNREMALLVLQGGDAIRNARTDIEDYGLAISAVDAGRIEVANDALGRLGLITQYAGQQLAISLVPAMGRMAEAMTESLRAGGLLRGMIDGLVGNLDVIISTMGVAVTVFGVRYVGALAAAKVATLTFAGSLAILKRALITTGIGALIVGAGWLVAKFGDVVTATGGVGAAFGLLGDVGAEVWKRIGYTMQAFKSRFVADFLGIKATALDGWQSILDGSYSMADGLIGVAVGSKDAFIAAWETLPAAFANIGARAINRMAEMIKAGANTLLSPLNAILGAAGMDTIVADWGNPVSVPDAENVGAAVGTAFSAAMGKSYVGAAPQTAGATADALRGVASSRDATADVWAGLASAPLSSLEALRAAASAVGDTVSTTNPSLTELGDALAEIGSGGGAGAAVDGLKGKISALKDSADDMKDTFKGTFKGIMTSAMSLKDAVVSVLSKIADKLLDSAFDSLWGGLGGGKGGGLLGSLFGGLFSANGNVFSGGSHVQAYANGGVVGGPTTFPIRGGKTGLMGEAGPEAIMPLTRIGGKLGVQVTGGGGGGAQAISVSVNVEGASGDQHIVDLVQQGVSQGMSQVRQEVPGLMTQYQKRRG